ncbi:MAG: chorismate mutase [Dorea sp.]|nr:chorismate mutase [Dorea sp.]
MPLSEVRVKIDRIDQQMKDLFIERMSLAEQVVEVKAQTGDVIYKPDREASMLEARSKDVAAEIQGHYKAFLGKVISVSKEYQYERMLEMGDRLSFEWKEEPKTFKKAGTLKSQLYVCDMFPKDEVKVVDTWDQLMTMIETGVVDAGVGIIETVGDDVYGELYKVIANYNLYINELKIIPDGEAVRKVAVFSKELFVKPEHKFVNFMFKCEYKAGSLSKVISTISDAEIRIRKIHSIPSQDEERRYDFYIVIEANLLNKKTQAVLRQIESENIHVQMVGSY